MAVAVGLLFRHRCTAHPTAPGRPGARARRGAWSRVLVEDCVTKTIDMVSSR